MEYCLQNLEVHRFGDVNPLSIEELYARYAPKSLFHDAASVTVQPFCSSSAHHHRLATCQSQLCGLLAQCSLGERLGSHSQLRKQQALARLVKSLLTCQLESQQLEAQHNALCLVYWLARRPLDSAYIPPEEECDVAGQSETQLHPADVLLPY